MSKNEREESMTVLYVAGPMTGYADYNYPAFNWASADLREVGYEVLNPVDSEKHNPTPGRPQSWDWYMRHAIRMVMDAEGIAVLTGWEKSKGAKLEVLLALELGMRVCTVEDWLHEKVFAKSAAATKVIETDLLGALQRSFEEHRERRERREQEQVPEKGRR